MRTGAQLGRGKKSAPILGKSPDCVHAYFRFAVQNLVLRVSNRKNFKMFPYEVCSSGIFDQMSIGVS